MNPSAASKDSGRTFSIIALIIVFIFILTLLIICVFQHKLLKQLNL